MGKKEYFEQFLSAFRPYFHYQAEITIVNDAGKDGKKRDVVVVENALEENKMFTIDQYYTDFKKGKMDIGSIAKYCYIGFLTMVSPGMLVNSKFLDIWDHTKDLVIFRIEGLFEPDPNDYLAKLKWNGLTVVFQLELPEYTVDVTEKLLELWEVDVKTVFEAAKENTKRKYQPNLILNQEHEDELSLEIGTKMSGAIYTLYELDDEEENTEEGLRCILYDWLMREIAKKIGSYYILPANLGGALLLAESGLVFTKEQMLQSLILQTKSVPPELRVQISLLRYDAETHTVEQII